MPEPRGLPCPECGGELGPLESGDVHCFRRCGDCGARVSADDPRLNPGR